ncbi:MAG TPA: 50S ribosomal protein L6 [Polyangiales bacterium]
MTTAAATEANRQSRVGKVPVGLPKGVEFSGDATKVKIKGPKGTLERKLPPFVQVKKDGENLVVGITSNETGEGPKFQGLTRALVANMVKGVSTGYAIALDLYGVGYRAELKGKDLTLSLGLSHQVKYALPAIVNARVETLDEGGIKRPRLHLDSADKELLGQVAARIRSFRPPEPYKGKGVRYMGEKIRTKAGKAGKSGAKGK